MSKLLLKVKADALRSIELIPAILEIYDDKIIFRDKGLLSRKESTISYKQVSQVSINKGLIHSTLEVINTGGYKNIKLEHIGNKLDLEAKELIENFVHIVHTSDFSLASNNDPLKKLEELKILLEKGFINEKEFNAKRKEILSRI